MKCSDCKRCIYMQADEGNYCEVFDDWLEPNEEACAYFERRVDI